MSRRERTALSAKGRPCDNAVAESFFSIIKKEELYRYQYRGINDFRKSVDSYIEYYNERRVHSFLGYMSPAQFEAKYCEQMVARATERIREALMPVVPDASGIKEDSVGSYAKRILAGIAEVRDLIYVMLKGDDGTFLRQLTDLIFGQNLSNALPFFDMKDSMELRLFYEFKSAGMAAFIIKWVLEEGLTEAEAAAPPTASAAAGASPSARSICRSVNCWQPRRRSLKNKKAPLARFSHNEKNTWQPRAGLPCVFVRKQERDQAAASSRAGSSAK